MFFTGNDGSMLSNRAFCQAAGHYACDLFAGSYGSGRGFRLRIGRSGKSVDEFEPGARYRLN